MSAMTQSTQPVSPCPVHTDLPTTGDGTKLHMRHDDPVVSAEKGLFEKSLFEKMSTTLEEMLDVLQGSAIAEERGTDVQSKFWVAYNKVSSKYDDDFLGRADDDMSIILIFAGLFSTVNSTFIIGMQPNPGDTTNILMVQLIKAVTEGSGAVDINNLSESTTYPSSIVWMSTLAYASLSFSLLAAFGAVMGKQWLNSYRAARGRRLLAERGMERQMKLDGLEYWRMRTVLKAFLILLQISLLFFGLSLSARMWTVQRTISIVILSTTAFGTLFHGVTLVISVLHPDSPYQTTGSVLLSAICKRISPRSARNTFMRFLPRSARNTFMRFLPRSVRNTFMRFLPPVRNTFMRFLPRSVRNTFMRFLPRSRNTSTRFLPSSLRNFLTSSAIRWILETSTNSEVVELAVTMVPLVQWSRRVDTSGMCVRLRDAFRTYRDRQELFAKCGKALAHLSIQSANTVANRPWNLWDDPDAFGGKSRLIRDAFIAGHDAWDKLKVAKNNAEQKKLKADARTALKTIVIYGHWSSSSSKDEDVIWLADLQWRHDGGHTPRYEEFNWLVDYLVEKVDDGVDEETQGDALLALSAMHGLGSPAKRPLYVNALIHCMGPTSPPRVRNAALRAVFDARREVASIANDSVQQGIDTKLLDELSHALLNTVRPNRDQVHDNALQDLCYLRLLFSLVQNDEWHQRLARDGHIDLCISLAAGPSGGSSHLYLIAIFMRISGNLPPGFTQEKWQNLIYSTWTDVYTMITSYTDYFFETFPALVTATRQNFNVEGPSNDMSELKDLTQLLRKVIGDLRRVQNRSLVSTRRIRDFQGVEASDVVEQANLANGQARDLFDTVFRDVQGLYDDLSRMIEHPNTSQGDKGFVG